MRITVRLEKAILEQACLEADRRGETLSSLIEEGLRLVMAHPRRASGRKKTAAARSASAGEFPPASD